MGAVPLPRLSLNPNKAKVTYSDQWEAHYVYGPSGGFTKVTTREYHESCLVMHQAALALLKEQEHD